MLRSISIPKFEEQHVNEDAVRAEDNVIAIADGAGGYGIFSDEWSNYLVESLPQTQLAGYPAFTDWIDEIWEVFYHKKEQQLDRYNGFVKNKFYKEGTCSTLVAGWPDGEKLHWIKYGDSALFIYDKEKKLLLSQPDSICSFAENPYLINWKEETVTSAFTFGTSDIKNKVVFLASDALACYLLLSYKLINNIADEDIQVLKKGNTFLSNQYGSMKKIIDTPTNYYETIIHPLVQAAKNKDCF